MIDKNLVMNYPNDPYLNKCIQGAIPLINMLSLSEIKQYDSIIKNYYAEILSRVSLLNAYIYFIMDNFIRSQKYVYIKNLHSDINDIRKFSGEIILLDQLNFLIAKMISKLESLKIDIESTHYLYPDSLSIYNKDNIENGINYMMEKNDSSIIFNYFEGRSTLQNTIKLLEYFSKNKDSYVDKEDSLDISHIDKVNKAIENYTTEMKTKVDATSQVEELIDSSKIAILTYAQYNFTSQQSIDLFLGRKYSTIKEEIIIALINKL